LHGIGKVFAYLPAVAIYAHGAVLQKAAVGQIIKRCQICAKHA